MEISDSILVTTPGPCFMCKELTYRIDIDFGGYFCNSKQCNRAIEEDLKNYE